MGSCVLCRRLLFNPAKRAVTSQLVSASIGAKGDELHLLCLNFHEIFNGEEEEIQMKTAPASLLLILRQQDWETKM